MHCRVWASEDEGLGLRGYARLCPLGPRGLSSIQCLSGLSNKVKEGLGFRGLGSGGLRLAFWVKFVEPGWGGSVARVHLSQTSMTKPT